MHTKAVDRSRPVQIASTPASQEKTSPKTQIDTRSKSSITPQSQESSCCSWLINALKSFGRSLLYCLTFQWLFTSKKSSKEGADKSQDASTKSAVKEEKKPVVKKETKAPEDKPQQASSVREIRQPSQTPSSLKKSQLSYAPSRKVQLSQNLCALLCRPPNLLKQLHCNMCLMIKEKASRLRAVKMDIPSINCQLLQHLPNTTLCRASKNGKLVKKHQDSK